MDIGIATERSSCSCLELSFGGSVLFRFVCSLLHTAGDKHHADP